MKKVILVITAIIVLHSCATISYSTYTTYADITQYESGKVIGYWPEAMLVQTLSSAEAGQFIKVGGSLSFTTKDSKKMFISGGAIVAENIRTTREVQESPSSMTSAQKSFSMADVKDKNNMYALTYPVRKSAGRYAWITSESNSSVSVSKVSFGKEKTIIILKDSKSLFAKDVEVVDSRGRYVPVSIETGMAAITYGDQITTITLDKVVEYPFTIINTGDASLSLIDVKSTL